MADGHWTSSATWPRLEPEERASAGTHPSPLCRARMRHRVSADEDRRLSDMQSMQGQSTSQESDVRQAIVNALMPRAEQTKVVQDQPGTLIVDVGSVGKAFLMGGFRNAMKMPMRITVNTQGGPGGTGITIHVGSHGTGGGYMSGGWLGVVKQRKAEKAWMDI